MGGRVARGVPFGLIASAREQGQAAHAARCLAARKQLLRESLKIRVEVAVALGLEEAHECTRALAGIEVDQVLVEVPHQAVGNLIHACCAVAEPAQVAAELGHVAERKAAGVEAAVSWCHFPAPLRGRSCSERSKEVSVRFGPEALCEEG